MRVDPWLGLVSFQPLGGSNRLRKIVYPEERRAQAQAQWAEGDIRSQY